VVAHDRQLGAGGVVGVELADGVEEPAAFAVIEQLAGQGGRGVGQALDGLGDEVVGGRVQVEQAGR
jgi:hypothetical protein